MTYSRKGGISWLEYNIIPTVFQSGLPLMMRDLKDDMAMGLEMLGGQLDNLKYTCDRGFNGVMQGIEYLGGLFDCRMTMAIEQMQTTNEHLKQVLENLDEIHQTLLTPTQTQALEFRDMGTARLARGLYDKAIESFLEAEKLNDTDFITQLQLGKLYLYGKDKYVDVIDLNKALAHLTAAVRYGTAEIKYLASTKNTALLREVNFLLSEACFHAAQTLFVLGNEAYQKEGNKLTEPVKKLYKRMLEYTRDSYTYGPLLTVKYLEAKANLMLENPAQAILILKKIFEKDFTFFYMFKKDKDYNDLQEQINKELLKLKPKGKNNQCMLSYELMKLNNPKRAIEEAEKALCSDVLVYERFKKPIFAPIEQELDSIAFWAGIKQLKPCFPDK